jgi:3-oxoacyl-[acyl-carrier protein] reductase
MTRLDGKVAVVTGASKGIGAGIVKEFAKAGASVVANYARNRQDAEKLIDQIKADGGTAIAVQADVSQADDVEQLFKAAVGAFGQVSILVNNAGIFEFGPVETITQEHFQRLYATNVWGAIQTTQRALKCFREGGGSIINISSGVTRMLAPGSALYAGTKGALELITIVLSKELGPRQIRVNAISPGATDTEGAQAVGAMSEQSKERYTSLTPLGRVGKPEDIAQLALFLASDESSWITGEVIHASGGLR